MRVRPACFCALLLLQPGPPAAAQPLLVILQETGQERDGLPVYTENASAESVRTALSRGLSGKLLRLYRCEQNYLAQLDGSTPEPAYLLLSHNQGGFPRFGFFLDDQDKRQTGYVDLQLDIPAAGRFGALDQLFPHELAHVVVQQLAGEPQAGGSNRIHAIGVTTDRNIAFQEGFAEHFQVLAVDDPAADPRTRSLAHDTIVWGRAEQRLRSYANAMSATWYHASRPRMAFPLWFSQTEQAMRYHAVRSNAFVYEPPVPARLLGRSDPWPAYLLENVLPGVPSGPPKTLSRILACEGAVSSLFVHWSRDPVLRSELRDESFYARFGIERSSVDPLDNVYLKLFEVLHAHRPQDTVELVQAYRSTFPDESTAVDSVLRSTFFTADLSPAPPIWIVNDGFEIGTSLFDQFRRAPRPHTFDLNAASLVDLLAIPRMDRVGAERILRRAPFVDIDGLARVEGVTPETLARFRSMASKEASTRAAEAEQSAVRRLRAILMAYVWHAVAFLTAAAAAGAILYRRTRPSPWRRSVAVGSIAALTGLLAAWTIDAPPFPTAIVVPLALGGVPSTLWCLIRRRPRRELLRVLAGWSLAALPAAILVQPWL